MQKNAIQNFEIPVADLPRAKKFYGAVLGEELAEMEFQGIHLAMFPFDAGEGGVGGTLVKAPGVMMPSKTGTVVYLNAGDDLSPCLPRIRANGGTVVVEKTELAPGMGYYAIFDDTEGNRVGLYSKN